MKLVADEASVVKGTTEVDDEQLLELDGALTAMSFAFPFTPFAHDSSIELPLAVSEVIVGAPSVPAAKVDAK